MKPREITPDNTVFALISFEGPDRYSRAGGLATRISELAEALAQTGFETHLVFVGDPNLPGRETLRDGKLTLHRWCQWISKYHPGGVYQAEERKLYDFNNSVPLMINDEIVAPSVAQGKVPVIMGEEWHTAETMCRISDLLYFTGLRDHALLVWNANNVFSFQRINWGRLDFTTTITTVSRFMKHVMWDEKVDPIVIPNGVPERLLETVNPRSVQQLHEIFASDALFFKLGRWDPDKRWIMAVQAMAQLKAAGVHPTLIMRGGVEPHEGEVLRAANALGLSVAGVYPEGESVDAGLAALAATRHADVLNVKSYLSEDVVRLLYAASDGVLANSGFEPFGLVGLEAMAAGAVAYTGCTGEDYAVPFENAVVVETADPAEIARYALHLLQRPIDAERIRAAGREMAEHFVWPRVIGNLVTKLEFLGQRFGILSTEGLRVPLKDGGRHEPSGQVPGGKALPRRSRAPEKDSSSVLAPVDGTRHH